MTFIRSCIFIIACATLVGSCKKDEGFGSSLLPGEETLGLVFDDTTELQVSSVYESPLRTDRLLFNYLGSLDNSIFGNVFGSNTIQLGRPVTVPPDSLGPYTLKSVVLNLTYDKVYGDTTQPLTWNVHMLGSRINEAIIYNSDFEPNYGNQVIGSISNALIQPNVPIKFSETDTSIGKTKLLQFKMENYVGLSLINQIQAGTLTSDSTYKNIFPGIFIKPSSIQPGKLMLQMNYTDATSGLYVYMKNGAGQDVTMVLPVATTTFVHSGFKHNYQGSVVASIASSTLAGKEKAYIQSQAGVKTMLKIVNPEKFKGKLINKAVIEIFEVEKTPGGAPLPRSIFPLKRSSSGANELMADYTSAFYGPALLDTFTADINGNKIVKYEINVSNYLKNLALGKEQNNGIYLTNYPVFDLTPGFILLQANVVQPQYIEPSAVIIGGTDYIEPSKRMRLKVWYSLPK